MTKQPSQGVFHIAHIMNVLILCCIKTIFKRIFCPRIPSARMGDVQDAEVLVMLGTVETLGPGR